MLLNVFLRTLFSILVFILLVFFVFFSSLLFTPLVFLLVISSVLLISQLFSTFTLFYVIIHLCTYLCIFQSPDNASMNKPVGIAGRVRDIIEFTHDRNETQFHLYFLNHSSLSPIPRLLSFFLVSSLLS